MTETRDNVSSFESICRFVTLNPTMQCKVFKEQFEFNIPCVDVEGSENDFDRDSGNV